jgi:hypothetical protein
MEQLGCRDQARLYYQRAYEEGFKGAKFRLDSIDSPGTGLLPPSRPPQRTTHFKCPS